MAFGLKWVFYILLVKNNPQRRYLSIYFTSHLKKVFWPNIVQSIHLAGSFWCRTEATAPWAMKIDAMDFAHFHVIRRGNYWFDMDDL